MQYSHAYFGRVAEKIRAGFTVNHSRYPVFVELTPISVQGNKAQAANLSRAMLEALKRELENKHPGLVIRIKTGTNTVRVAPDSFHPSADVQASVVNRLGDLLTRSTRP